MYIQILLNKNIPLKNTNSYFFQDINVTRYFLWYKHCSGNSIYDNFKANRSEMTCQGKVVDVDEVEYPIRESLHLSVDCQLHALVHVDDGPDK